MPARVRGLKKNLGRVRKTAFNASKQAMNECMTDLLRVSSEAAPLDDGDLEMSGEKSVRADNIFIKGTVRYEVWNDHPGRSYDFNYAIWTHEEFYKLGPRSAAKAGGKGISGKTYPVGRQYLKAPFIGEAEAYRNVINNSVKAALKG